MALGASAQDRPERLFPLWLAIGGILCAIFLYGCLMRSPPSEPAVPFFDKMEHAFAFIVMGAWFGALFPQHKTRTLIALSAYGAVTELLQWASGYRDGDPRDWLADTFGILLGLAFVRAGLMRWLVLLDRRVAATRNKS